MLEILTVLLGRCADEKLTDYMKFIQGLKKVFKSYFTAGIAVVVPLIATILILKFIITWTDALVSSLLPEQLSPEEIFGKNIPGFGLIATIILILVAGIFTRLYIGRKLVHIGDRIISRIPLGRGIYSGIKQFLSTIFSSNSQRFKSVVAVEYPRKECWVIGFVTSDCIPEVQVLAEDTMVNIFIPTTPNPTSGFMIMVPKGDITPLSVGIDEAFKLIISGGIVQNPQARTSRNS